MRLKHLFENGFPLINLVAYVTPRCVLVGEREAMGSAKNSWKDVKPVLSGFSSTQLLGLVQDLYRLNAKNASFNHHRRKDISFCSIGICWTSLRKPWFSAFLRNLRKMSYRQHGKGYN